MAIRSLIRTGNWKDVLDLIKEQPKVCKVRGTQLNNLLIHEACMNGAPVSVVSALLEVYPKSVSAKDKSGMTPLDHAMATTGTSNEVVELLLKRGGGGGVQKAIDKAMPSNARRRRREKRRTLDALPSLGSSPEK
jgi:ankyrin repeat protein